MSKLYIIAGCNGAGKTTASYTVLPEILECREFVNADEIAKGLCIIFSVGERKNSLPTLNFCKKYVWSDFD